MSFAFAGTFSLIEEAKLIFWQGRKFKNGILTNSKSLEKDTQIKFILILLYGRTKTLEPLNPPPESDQRPNNFSVTLDR